MNITCYDVYGKAVSVAADSVTFAPAVYGLFFENEHVLLSMNEATRLWEPPGKIVLNQIDVQQAVQQHFRQLVRFVPIVDALIWVETHYRLDGAQQAWHLSAMYYRLKRPLTHHSAGIKSGQRLAWIPLAELDHAQMQFGYEALLAAQRQQLLQTV